MGDVATYEAIDDELLFDRAHRSDDARIVGGQEADEGEHQQARVGLLRAVVLHERVERAIEPALADLRVERAPDLPPAIDRAGELPLLDRTHGAVEGDPRHHLRVYEVTQRAAHFPDAAVGLRPDGVEMTHERALEVPSGV